MALATATITYDLADLVGLTPGNNTRRWSVTAYTNIPGDTIIDTAANEIRLGSGKSAPAADGSGTITVWIPGTGSNPASWQTYFGVKYPDPREPSGRGVRIFGPFTITASADLADLVDEQQIPPEYAGAVVAEMQALHDATAAIAGADTADDLIVALDATPASAFRVQQDARHSAAYASKATQTTVETGRLSSTDIAAGLATRAPTSHQHAVGDITGLGNAQVGYAERTTNFTTTNTTVLSPTLGIITSLSVTVTGTGRPVDIEFYTPAVAHSAGAIVTTTLVRQIGAGSATAIQYKNWASTFAEGGTLRSNEVLTNGTSYTFTVAVGANAAGTSTIVGSNAGVGKMYLAVTNR